MALRTVLSAGPGSPVPRQSGCLTLRAVASFLLSAVLSTVAVTARGELQLVPTSEPARIFAGAGRSFPVAWRNPGDGAVTADVRMRLLQTTSATKTTLGEWPWKQLQVLPGQTITEHATLDFPDVKAETRFLVQWMKSETGAASKPRSSGRESAPSNSPASESRLMSAATTAFLGTTEVFVYPTHLLAELKPLTGEDQPVGVFDPANLLKPLLKAAAVEFEDMEDSGVAAFRGKLAIIGPFMSREQMPGDLTERIEKLARTGTGIVWLQPPPAPREKLQPSFRSVAFGSNAVVVVQPQLVSALGENPQAQLNLIRFSQLACNPEPPALPRSNPATP